MELDQFIQRTIEQVITGMTAAKPLVERHGGRVNPYDDSTFVQRPGRELAVHHIEFDVALTDSTEAGGTGKIGVQLGAFQLGGGGGGKSASESLTRIRFRIPVGLPPSSASFPTTEES